MKQAKKRSAQSTTEDERPQAYPRAMSAAGKAKVDLLEQLVPQLARSISPLCEVVLHENSSHPPTIRAIGNGHVTGRTVGDIMTYIYMDGADVTDRTTPLYNYLSRMPDGRLLRVSLLPILDEGEVIAYVAVNMLVHDMEMARQVLTSLVQAEPHAETIEEAFLSPSDVIAKIAEDYTQSLGRPLASLDKDERIELVRRFREGGIFGMRGAVETVAGHLGLSRTAVYNYLKELDRSQ